MAEATRAVVPFEHEHDDEHEAAVAMLWARLAGAGCEVDLAKSGRLVAKEALLWKSSQEN